MARNNPATSRTPQFMAKTFLQQRINQGLQELGIDAGNAVVVTGRYGEKAAVFFAQDGGPEAPDSDVGFFIVTKNEGAKHQNMSREAAADLVALLIEGFDFEVETQEVPVTTYETRIVIS